MQRDRIHRLSQEDKLVIETLIRYLDRKRFGVMDMEQGLDNTADGIFIGPNGRITIFNKR